MTVYSRRGGLSNRLPLSVNLRSLLETLSTCLDDCENQKVETEIVLILVKLVYIYQNNIY